MANERGGRFRVGIADALLLILSLALAVGVATVFHACGAHADGAFGSCHWAQRAELGIGIALSALALARLFLGRAARRGLDLAFIALGALAAALPKGLIALCGMASMACNRLMRPATLVLGILIAAVALADLALRRGRSE